MPNIVLRFQRNKLESQNTYTNLFRKLLSWKQKHLLQKK
jgi:hypothetical protein